MIEGFKDQTMDLTPNEIELANYLLKGFNNHVTREHAISSTKIIAQLKAKGIDLAAPRLRKIIHYIRVNRLAPRLVADDKGYYIEPNDKKLAKYIDTLFSRVFSISQIIKSYRVDMPDHVDRIDREYLSKLKHGVL